MLHFILCQKASYHRGPQPFDHGPLTDHGLFETGLPERWASTHVRSSTRGSGGPLRSRMKLRSCKWRVRAPAARTNGAVALTRVPATHTPPGQPIKAGRLGIPALSEAYLHNIV